MTKTEEKMKHHKWSPSKWMSFKSCPHYKSDDKTSEVAERGTLQHSLLEALGNSDELEVQRISVLLTSSELNNVEYVYNYCMKLVTPGQESMEWEDKIDAIGSDMTVIPGHADLRITRDDKVIIVDAKFGVVKEYAPQLEVYALGAMQKHSRDNAEYHIVYGQEKQATVDSISKDGALLKFDEQVKILKEVDADPKSHPRQMNDTCKWCARNHNCPAINNSMTQLRSYRGPGLDKDETKALLKSVKARTNYETMPLDDLANILSFFKTLSGMEKMLKETMTNRISAGEESVLYKMQHKAGRRKIETPGMLYTEVQKLCGGVLDPNEFIAAGTYSISKMMDLIYADDAGKKASKEHFDENFGLFITRGNESVSLVKRSAKEIKKMIEMENTQTEGGSDE